MMKKALIILGIIFAIVALMVFNKMISKKGVVTSFAETKRGMLEITVNNSGELIAENSIDVLGPLIGMPSNGDQGGNNQGSGGQGGGGQRGGGQGTGGQGTGGQGTGGQGTGGQSTGGQSTGGQSTGGG